MTYKESKPVSEKKTPNKLVKESSPYLLQHAYNPVKWHPWGEEALKRAKEEDKPILVSIGYSACHWCHVMERESFEDDDIAGIMNEKFINIKVDREERPDIDHIYMDALQTMNVRGGWPLNVFLTPDAKPFYGGTYFPPAHWTHLLKQIDKAFHNNRQELVSSAEEFTKALNQSDVSKHGLTEVENSFDIADLELVFKKLENSFDKKMGGTEKAPKFPMPVIYSFLLKYHYLTKDENALRHVKLTLDKMACGGIYDQIGGGFTRYSTDENWFAPHFEKMLYDNGQLISLYSEAYASTKEIYYKNIVLETIEWAKREMMDKNGAFYSSLDADIEGEEGKFYVWTNEELTGVLNSDYELFKDYYNINTRGNWEQGNNILHKKLSDKAFTNKHDIDRNELESKINNWKETLLEKRSERGIPGKDDKILASWNALMLNGLVNAYRYLQNDSILETALNNANFIKDSMISNNKLYHNYKQGKVSIDGYLEDYAFVIDAFINLYQATFDEQWLKTAEKLTEYVMINFYDPAEDMFFFTDIESERLIARKKEIFDNVIPASNSVMASNLFKLGKFLENNRYEEVSRRMVSRIKKALYSEPAYLANWASLAALMVKPIAEVAIIGPEAGKIRKELDKNFIPNVIYSGAKKTSELPLLKERVEIGGKTTIYVCYNKTCQLPVHLSSEAVKQVLESGK